MQVALFGGSFDPPHVGHVLGAAYLLSVGPFDKVLVVPVFSHAFEKPLSSFAHRLQMCKLAFDFLPGVEVSDVERHLPVPNRTLTTVEHLRDAEPTWSLRLVIGADVLEETSNWYGFARVKELAPLWVLGRAGIESDGAPLPVLPRVSSTDVRRLFRADDQEALCALVPRDVLRYAREKGLYACE